MFQNCLECGRKNPSAAAECLRCGATLKENTPASADGGLARRLWVLVIVILAVIAGFYASLVRSADPLASNEKAAVERAIDVLNFKGFTTEAALLRHAAVFRRNDNWLNASVAKENAFAATNFPFEIVTLYPDFFTYPADDTERAAILLHEAKHLEGRDEPQAYEYVWKNRGRLGWTQTAYGRSEVWLNVRRQTREYRPNLFICQFNDFGDCTGSD